MKRLFWCAALLVLLAVVSYITTSCYASGSESLASATSTTAAPLSAVQKEQAAESPTQDARLVVGKYTLSNRDVANGKSGPTVLDALGLSNLLPGQLILIKGGSGMYRTSTEEAKRERSIMRFTNNSSAPAVANALARCYRVIDTTSATCRADTVTPLLFLRRPHEGGSVYLPAAETAAVRSACKDKTLKCTRADCTKPAKLLSCARTCDKCASPEHNPSVYPPRTCAEPTPCPVQVSFDYAPSAIESYGEGTFAYASGFPALTPLDEGKTDVRTWEKGRVRAFYGAVRNFGYDYKNSEFKFKGDDNPHWFFSWTCPWGGKNHDGTPWGVDHSQRCPSAWQGKLEKRKQSFKGNAKRVYNGDINTDRGNCMVCNLAGQVPGPDAAFWVGGGNCPKRGYTKQGKGHFGSSVCSPPVNKLLGEATFHSRVWAADGGEYGIGTLGADYLCSEKVLGKKRWSAPYHAGMNNGYGAYPSFVRGAARASIRNDELLGVCNMYREVTPYIDSVLKTGQKVKHLGAPFARQTTAEDRVLAEKGNRDYYVRTIDYPESHLVVTDSDGQLLAKMPPYHTVDFNRAPFAGSEGNGPSELGPQLSWLPEKADGRASMEPSAKGESCTVRCHARGKYCVDLHELGPNNLHSFVYGSETASSVAEKTMHVRCDENPHQVVSSGASLSCLCGRLVAHNTRAAVHTATTDNMSCDAVCATQGLKCMAFDQLSRAAEAELTASTTNTQWELCHLAVKKGASCMCAAHAVRPMRSSSQANTGGANQWFLPGAAGVQYKSARTGRCYSLASACRGSPSDCVTGLNADSTAVACDVPRSPWIDTSINERRSRAAHPMPHVFGQDPDALVSHHFWSDITVARTREPPTTDSHGGEGGGCGASYPFDGDGRDGHIYTSAPVAAGTKDVGANTFDTRQRFRCNYRYTSEGRKSVVSLAKLVGSNRKWKAWWGSDITTTSAASCRKISRELYSLATNSMYVSPLRYDRGFGHHMWVEAIYDHSSVKKCRVYTDVTAAISKRDGLLLDATNLSKASKEAAQRIAALKRLKTAYVMGGNQELRLHDEMPATEVKLSWNSSETCLARCADTRYRPDKGTCASAYDAAGRISGDIGCNVEPKPDNFWRAFYGTEGLNYSIVAKGADLHTRATTTCNYYATGLDREYRQASSYPKRLRGYSSISADHKLVRCRSYREVTNEIHTLKKGHNRDMLMNDNYLERQVFTESQKFRHMGQFLNEPPNGGYMPHGQRDATKRLVIINSAGGEAVSPALHERSGASGTCAAYCSAIAGIPGTCTDFEELTSHDHDLLGGMALVLKLTEGRRCSESSTAACLCQEHADVRAPISAVFETGDYALDLTRWPFTFVPDRATERSHAPHRPSHLFDTGSDVTTVAAHFGSSCTANEEPFFTTTTAKGSDYATPDEGGVLRWPVVRVSYHQPSVARVGNSAVAVGNRPMPLMDPVIARTRLFNWRWETAAGTIGSANQANQAAEMITDLGQFSAFSTKKTGAWESCTRSWLHNPAPAYSPYPPLKSYPEALQQGFSKAFEAASKGDGGEPCRSNGDATGWGGNDVVKGNAYRVFTENDKFYQATTARCFVAKSSCPGCLRAIASSQDTDFGMSPKSMTARVPSRPHGTFGKLHWGPPIADRLEEVVCPENGGAHTCAAFCRTHGGFCLAKRETPPSESRPADLVTDCHALLGSHSAAAVTPPTAGAFVFERGRTYVDKSGGSWRMMKRIAVDDVVAFDLRKLSPTQAVASKLRPSPTIQGLTKIHHALPKGGNYLAGHAYKSPQKHTSGPMRGYHKYFKAKRYVQGAPSDYDGLADASVGEYVPIADPAQADADGKLRKGFIYRSVSREARKGPGKYWMILDDITIGISRGSGPNSSTTRGRAFDIEKQVPWNASAPRGFGQRMPMSEWDYPNKPGCEFLKGFTYRSPSTSALYRIKRSTVIPATQVGQVSDVYEKKAGVGSWGGTCTCPNGIAYEVGDLGDACGPKGLACYGGTAGTCSKGGIGRGKAGYSVTCMPAASTAVCDVAGAALTDVAPDTTEDNGAPWCACGHLEPAVHTSGSVRLIHHEFPEGGYHLAGHAYKSPQKHTSGPMRGYHKYFKAKRYVGGAPSDYDGLADASVGEYVPIADPAQADTDNMLRKGFIYRSVSREAQKGPGKYFMMLRDVHIGPRYISVARGGRAFDIDTGVDSTANFAKKHLPEWDFDVVSPGVGKSYEDSLRPDLRCVCARRKAEPIMTRVAGEYFDGLGDKGLLAWARSQTPQTAAQGGVACSLAATNVPMDEPLPALSEWHWQTARCAQDNPLLSVNWAVGGEFRPAADKSGNAPPSKCACARYFGYDFERRTPWLTDCNTEITTTTYRGHGIFRRSESHSMQGVPACASNFKSRIIQPKSYLDRDADYVDKGKNMSPYLQWVRWLNRDEDGGGDGTMKPAGSPAGDLARSYFCCSSHKRSLTAAADDGLHARDVICRRNYGPVVGVANVFGAPLAAKLPELTAWISVPVPSSNSSERARHANHQCHLRVAGRSTSASFYHSENPLLTTVRAVAVAPLDPDAEGPIFSIRLAPSRAQRAHAGDTSQRKRLRICRVRTGAQTHTRALQLNYVTAMVPTGTSYGNFDRLHYRTPKDLPESVRTAWGLDDGDESRVVDVTFTYGDESECKALTSHSGVVCGETDHNSAVVRVPGSSDALGYNEFKDPVGAAYTSRASGLSSQEQLNIGLYQRAGVMRARGSNFHIAAHSTGNTSKADNTTTDRPHFLPNDFGDASRMCGRLGLQDGVAKQNALRQRDISQFHTQYGLSRRVLRGRAQAGDTTGVSQAIYAQLPDRVTYAYSAYNPIADLAFAFKSWGFHETTPCRPRHFRDAKTTEGRWPSVTACGRGKGDDAGARWLYKFTYSEVKRVFSYRDTAHEVSECVMHNGCNAEAMQGTPIDGNHFAYYDTAAADDARRARQLSSAWHASRLGGDRAPSASWAGLRGSETKIAAGEQAAMYRVNDKANRPEWRDVGSRQQGHYYAAPVHDRSAHRYCGLTVGPRMITTAGRDAGAPIVADSGGRQYDAAACYRFDACHAPVVFGTRQKPHPSGNVPHLSVQKASLMPSCGRSSYGGNDIDMPTAAATTAKRWQEYAQEAAKHAAPYMQLMVREADVHARASHVFGGQPSRGELFAARTRLPCATSMSYAPRDRGDGVDGIMTGGVGGGFRCDTTWHVDIGAGVANAPPSVHNYGTAVRTAWRGSIDDEVNTCATVGARYQIPRERDGRHGVQTRTTDAEPVLTFMPACAATLRDLDDDEEVYSDGVGVVHNLVEQRKLLSVSPWALGPDKKQVWPAYDLGSGQFGWGGYGTWAWPDERMKTAGKSQSVFRGAFYDYAFATGRELAYGNAPNTTDKYPRLKARLRGTLLNADLSDQRWTKTPVLNGIDDPEPRMVVQNGGWLGSALFLRPPARDDAKRAYWIRARAFGRYFSDSRTQHPHELMDVRYIRFYDNAQESDKSITRRTKKASKDDETTGRTARLQQLISDGGVADPAVKSGAALPFFDAVSRATTWFQDPQPLPSTDANDTDDWVRSEGIPAGTAGGAGWNTRDGVVSFARLCRRTLSRVKYTQLHKGAAGCREARVMRDGAGTRVVVTADGLRLIKGKGGCGCEALGGKNDDLRTSAVFDPNTTAALGSTCPPVALVEKDPIPALGDVRSLSSLRSNWVFSVRDVPLWARDVRRSQPAKSWMACAAGAKEVGAAFVFYDRRCWVQSASSRPKDSPYPPNTAGAATAFVPLAFHGERVSAFANFAVYTGPYRASAAVAGSMGPGDGLPAFYGDPATYAHHIMEVTAVSRRDTPGDTAFVARIGSAGEHRGLYMLAAPPGFVRSAHYTRSQEDGLAANPHAEGLDLVRAAVTCLLSPGCSGLVAVQRRADGAAQYTIAHADSKSPKTYERAAAATPGVLDPLRVRVIDGRELAPLVGVRTFEEVLQLARDGTTNEDEHDQYPRLYSDRPYRYRESLAAYLQHDPAHLAGTPLDLLQTSAIPEQQASQKFRRAVREAAAWELDRLATTHAALTADAHLDAVIPSTRMIRVDTKEGGTCAAACGAKNMGCATTATLRHGEDMSGDGGWRNGNMCDQIQPRGTPCYCRAYAAAKGADLESPLLDSRPCTSWKDCDSGACHLSDNGLLGRCARRTRMHAMSDVSAGYRGHVGVGVPYAFAREAAAMHRLYGATSRRTGLQLSHAVRIFSGPSTQYQDITLAAQRWMAGLPALPAEAITITPSPTVQGLSKIHHDFPADKYPGHAYKSPQKHTSGPMRGYHKYYKAKRYVQGAPSDYDGLADASVGEYVPIADPAQADADGKLRKGFIYRSVSREAQKGPGKYWMILDDINIGISRGSGPNSSTTRGRAFDIEKQVPWNASAPRGFGQRMPMSEWDYPNKATCEFLPGLTYRSPSTSALYSVQNIAVASPAGGACDVARATSASEVSSNPAPEKKTLHADRWAVVTPPHVPEVYTEMLVGDPAAAVAQLRSLQDRLARTRFCAAEGGTCLVSSDAATGVVRLGTVLQSLASSGNQMRLRTSADAHWEFETTCTCANGQQALVGMPKTPAWSLAAQPSSASGFILSDTITARHHADISYGTSSSSRSTARALTLTASDSRSEGVGPWYESSGQITAAIVQSVTKRATWTSLNKKEKTDLGHRMLTSSGGGPAIGVEVPFCAGGQASGVFRRTVQASEQSIYRRHDLPAYGEVRLGVAAECMGSPETLPRTPVDVGASVFCEPSSFPGAAERADGLGPARYCTFESAAAPRQTPTVVDALMAIVQGRVEVSVKPEALLVVVPEAPPHSFAQAYLRQVWRHHAWRHGVGVLGGGVGVRGGAPTRFESQRVGDKFRRWPNDPALAGDERAVLSMYNRIPTDRLLPTVYNKEGKLAQACKKDLGLTLGMGTHAGDGLSDFWMRQSRAGAFESCNSVFGNTADGIAFVRSRADRARQEVSRQSGMDTWTLLGCGGSQQYQKPGEETNILHVPGSEEGALMDVVLDATEDYVTANPGEYQLGRRNYTTARGALNKAGADPLLDARSTNTTFTVQQRKVAVQGHLLRAADADDRRSFVDALTTSGHRTGKYDAYNETEAVLRVDGALAPSQQQRWPGNVRPPLEHFAPLMHFASTTDDAWSSKVREAGCCAARYDDGQQAAWSVTTIKPVNNALHPGWATMGTFQMPQNSRANFYCSAEHNPAIRDSKCDEELHDLCYTNDSESDCVTFDGARGGKTSETDLRPARCMGFWARDVAVRTTCRAFSRSITNWKASSTSMEAYCQYHDVPKQQRDVRRTDPDDPRRLQCMHWCAWFCRQDTPSHTVGSEVNIPDTDTPRLYMCSPTALPSHPAAAGGWCERYMRPSDAMSLYDHKMQHAVNATILGAGLLTAHGGASRDTASFSENPMFKTSAQTYGACLADTSQNKRHTNACGCITSDAYGTVNMSTVGNAQCHGIQGCRKYGFVPYSAKTYLCNDKCSVNLTMINESISVGKGAKNNMLKQSAQCCSLDSKTGKIGCRSRWCTPFSGSRAAAIMECTHYPDPALPEDDALLTNTTAKCAALLSASPADSAWLQKQTQNEGGSRLVLSGYNKPLPTDAANTVLCMRHAGVYRCGRGAVLDLHGDDDDVPLSTRLTGDAEGNEGTAGFQSSTTGTHGLSACAVSCDTDAVLGADHARYATSSSVAQAVNTRVGRCLGFRYDMISGRCIPYGSSTPLPPPSPPANSVVVADASIGGGPGECSMQCDDEGAGSCADALIPAKTELGELGLEIERPKAMPVATATAVGSKTPVAGVKKRSGETDAHRTALAAAGFGERTIVTVAIIAVAAICVGMAASFARSGRRKRA